MRVGIIGAGLSGLVAARTLVAAGHTVVVIEKSRGLGGRLAARRVGDTVVDHGTPIFDAPPGSALADLVAQLPSDDLVQVAPDRWGYRSGATRLAKDAAAGLAVTLATRIAALRSGAAGIELAGEQGNTHGTVDAVIITAPAPQAADLLDASAADPERVALLRSVRYEPAVMILAGYVIAPPDRLEPFPVSAPFMRITAENVKGRPPIDGVVPVVARLTPERSLEMLEMADSAILDATLPTLTALCGAVAGPAWVQVKRWRYAQVINPLAAEAVNPVGARVLIAGDSVAADLAQVAASGRAAAERLLSIP